MKKPFSYLLFVIFISAFCLNWILQKHGVHIPVVHSYMDDLVCIPVMLFPLLIFYRKVLVKTSTYVLPVGYIISAWVILCVIFEIILPGTDTAHVSDFVDMIFYGLGGVIFFYMQKPFSQLPQVDKPILDQH